ncbi:uncharacterized mitochondrial protein AtMg00810-like [Telopea speciosissima]|uniref:uncharacterized mitochondrial protein AtMg00810-like n=1 Tax=Telopea speciosissima TaxID=54955 RepID=UPI001CC343AC|nr:uncharacterized mitochondrial protein AtMg00810-like [Telopea speciosissima]
MAITRSDASLIQDVQHMLHQQFHIKDLGQLKYFYGIEVARSSIGLYLCQQKYVLDILDDCGYTGAQPVDTPMEQNLKLSNDTGDLLADSSSYCRLVGRLIYLMVTRPDIIHTVNILSQFMHQPQHHHLDAAHCLLRYLKTNPRQGLHYRSDSTLDLYVNCDSNWANCPMTRRSTIGYCVLLSSSLISWKTKKQHTISQSSAEAKYRAMAVATCELIWLTYLLRDIGLPHRPLVPLYCDNQAALHIAANLVFYERTKHIEIDCHLVRE